MNSPENPELNFRVTITIEGPCRSGKSFLLERLETLLLSFRPKMACVKTDVTANKESKTFETCPF